MCLKIRPVTGALVQKRWHEGELQCSQKSHLLEQEQPEKLNALVRIIRKAGEWNDYYPIDPAAPIYEIEVYNSKCKESLTIEGNLINHEDGTTDLVEDSNLISFLDEILNGATVEKKRLSKVIEERRIASA